MAVWQIGHRKSRLVLSTRFTVVNDVPVLLLNQPNKYIAQHRILGDPGGDSGDEGKSKRAEKYGTKKSKERKLENLCFSGTNQKLERRRPFGTCLVRHFPQGLFSPFFTFLCPIYNFPPV